MSEHSTNPRSYPEQAAHDIVLELCGSGAFASVNGKPATSKEDGERLAEAVVAAHKRLTEHYRGLKTGQSDSVL